MKKLISLLMALVMLLSMCAVAAAEEKTLTTVTVYPPDATVTSGNPPSYINKWFNEEGLDIQVWAYSPEKTNAILASGDLPDVMYVTYKDLQTMIEGNMVLNLEEHLDKLPHVTADPVIMTAVNYVREFRSAGTEQLWAIPALINVQAEGDDTGRNAIRVLWDVYYAIGAPEIKDVYDLIPVMKQMMEYKPAADDGTKTWGTCLNSGTDSQYWRSIELWYKWFGYELDNLQYLLETDMFNAKYTSILEASRDSMYYKGLKFFNTCFREGVLDPDSINNDRNTQKAKVETSNAIMVPAGSTPGWPQKYLPIHLEGQKLYAENWGSPYGGDMFFVINPKTAHVDECLKFIDMMADADFYFRIYNGTEDLGLWYTGEDGHVYPTKLGTDRYLVPGFEATFSNGEQPQMWLDRPVRSFTHALSYTGPEGPRRARGMQEWPEIKEELNKNESNTQWREHFGFNTFTELLKAQDAYILTSPLTNVASFCTPVDEWTQLSLDALRDVMVTGSWKMVYAETDEEFDAIWDQMMKDCEELGGADIVAMRLEDLAKAKEIKDSLSAQ